MTRITSLALDAILNQGTPMTNPFIDHEIIKMIAQRQLDGSYRMGPIKPSTKLVDDLGMDSLARVEFVMTLEEKFGIEMTDAAAEELITVGDVVKAVDHLKVAA